MNNGNDYDLLILYKKLLFAYLDESDQFVRQQIEEIIENNKVFLISWINQLDENELPKFTAFMKVIDLLKQNKLNDSIFKGIDENQDAIWEVPIIENVINVIYQMYIRSYKGNYLDIHKGLHHLDTDEVILLMNEHLPIAIRAIKFAYLGKED